MSVEQFHPRSMKFLSYRLVALVRGRLWLQVLFGLALGVGTGMALGPSAGWLAPATPGVGIVILATLLRSVGVPVTGIALIMGVDRILDMSRTTVNVAGDLTACVALDRWVGGERTATQELREEARLEEQRAESGEDVIVDPEPETKTPA